MISGVVYTALRALVSDRCYPSRFPQEDVGPPGTTIPTTSRPTWPAIRYSIVSAINAADQCGTDTVDTDDTTVQIDIVDRTHGGMLTLRDLVISALLATDPPCTREGYLELWDAETRTHRGVLTYQFNASTPGGASP